MVNKCWLLLLLLFHLHSTSFFPPFFKVLNLDLGDLNFNILIDLEVVLNRVRVKNQGVNEIFT